MFSQLRKNLLYTDISSDVVEHDEDMDGDLWDYDGIEVYRGSFDPKYTKNDLQVYWLYDDNSKRVGLAEHDINNPEVFKSLWFRDTPFGTLFQEDGWSSKNSTLWSLLSNEAYQDCLEDDFKSVQDWALQSGKLLVTPNMLLAPIKLYTCETCGKKSLSNPSVCKNMKETVFDVSQFSILFLDDSFVLYSGPENSRAHQLLHGEACEAQAVEEQSSEESPLPSPESLHSPETRAQELPPQ
jgi:hypothetical protein